MAAAHICAGETTFGRVRDLMTAPTTTPADTTTCPHGKRAGITVCLYCRQEARVAARRRRTQLLMRVGGIVVGGGAVIGVLAATLVAIAPWSRSSVPEAAEVTPAPVTKETAKRADASPNASRTTPIAAPSTAQASTAHASTAQAIAPIVAEGRTDLGDSTFVERAGAEAVVHFDNSTLRTRFDEKFERIVRTTLPRIYGNDAQLGLDALPVGTLVRGDLLQELPTRGIELLLSGGRVLMLYPVTRAGETGPLVVGYRASARR
jgi:hypothetical protein